MTGMPRRAAVTIFLVFAFTYFLSALLRAVTATLAPVLSQELGLSAADLGLLAGAYFLGFAALQLPLGRALDLHGPRRTLLVLLTLAVLGCLAFALAGGMAALISARVLIGAGVAACLMAPLTCFRHLFTPASQLRANSWMLMSGSLGMVASTLPVHWLQPIWGWRGLFVALAAMLALSMALIAWLVPRDRPAHLAESHGTAAGAAGYGTIVRHRLFVRLTPLGFFVYGGLIAVQALWAGPWLTRVVGLGAEHAAQGLFFINVCMLLAFMAWGTFMPQLVRRGISPLWLVSRGVPICLILLLVNVLLGPRAGAWHWAAWCVACTFMTLSQPAVGQAFGPALAGRALSAFNLVIFAGVFCIQWGMGLTIDGFVSHGLSEIDAFRATFGLFGACGLLSYLWFLRGLSELADNPGRD